MTPRQPIGLLVATLLGTLFVLHALWFFPFRLDDAFILLRYANNVRHHNGWVFNAGERVEGFTSPAMVAIESVLLHFDVNGLWWAKALGLVSGVLLFIGAIRIARMFDGSSIAWIVAAFFVAISMPLAVGSVNGLETAPFAACCVWGLILAQSTDRGWRVVGGILLGGAVCFRPDGALAFAAALAVALFRRQWLGLFLSWAAIALPVTLVRYLYFGSLTTNTYLAKIAPDAVNRWESGVDYLLRFGATPALIAGLVALIALTLKRVEARSFALFAVAWTIYVVWTGGDWVPRGRFFVPIIPILAAGLGAGLAQAGLWLFRSQAQPATWAAGLAVLFVLVCLPSAWADTSETHQQINTLTRGSLDGRERLGRWLHRATSPRDTVALFDVGEVGYESHIPTIDTGGLTDRSVAEKLHESAGQYLGYLLFPDPGTASAIAKDVVARHPDMIVNVLNGPLPQLLADPKKVWKGAYKQDIAMMENPDFKANYEYLCHVPGEWLQGERYAYNLFVRKGYKTRLKPTIKEDGRALCE
jgi:hypothetical protein